MFVPCQSIHLALSPLGTAGGVLPLGIECPSGASATTARRVDVLVVLVDLRKQGDNVWSTRSTHDFLGKPKSWGDSL